jgi:hypothetical protein
MPREGEARPNRNENERARQNAPDRIRTCDLRFRSPENARLAKPFAATLRPLCDLTVAVVSTEGQASGSPFTPNSSIKATMRSRVAGSSEATTSQTRLRSTPR